MKNNNKIDNSKIRIKTIEFAGNNKKWEYDKKDSEEDIDEFPNFFFCLKIFNYIIILYFNLYIFYILFYLFILFVAKL